MQEERSKKDRWIITFYFIFINKSKEVWMGWWSQRLGTHVVRRLSLRRGLEVRIWVLFKELDFIW